MRPAGTPLYAACMLAGLSRQVAENATFGHYEITSGFARHPTGIQWMGTQSPPDCTLGQSGKPASDLHMNIDNALVRLLLKMRSRVAVAPCTCALMVSTWRSYGCCAFFLR